MGWARFRNYASGFGEARPDLSGLNPEAVPAALVRSHGPFTWGADAAQAGCHAAVTKEVAGMARGTELLSAPQHLLDKHYLRKHGPNACYGQGGRS